MNFPSSPLVNDTYSFGGKTWTWTGVFWRLNSAILFVPISSGGTNSSATPTAGGVAYGDGLSYKFTPAGSSTQVLQSNGAGAPSWHSLVASDVGLGSVENTALSTWAGTANVTTVGTIATGTWNATAIADGKIASALTGKTYNGLTLTAAATGFTVAGGTTSKTLTVSNTLALAGTDSSTLNIGTGGTLGSAAFTSASVYTAIAQTNFLDSKQWNYTIHAVDSRLLSNPSTGIGYVGGGRFRFSALNDDNTIPYADVIDLSTYTDSSGGGYNSLYFGKQSQLIYHKWGAAGATAWTTKTVAYLDSTFTGTWNGGVVTGQYGGTGVANTGKTITLGGNLTTSGAFATTLTATATTTLTLPTTGTLATLAGTEALSNKTYNGTQFQSSGTTGSPAYWQNGTVNASAGTAYAFLSRGTLGSAANNDMLMGYDTSSGVVATGTSTGLLFFGVRADGASWTKTGTGTITTAYGLYASAPTIGSTNWAGYFSGNVNITGDATLGQSTGASTNSFASGVTTSSNVKALNIGTGGASGSYTNINIGSATVGALNSVSIGQVAGGGNAVSGTFSVTGVQVRATVLPITSVDTGTFIFTTGVHGLSSGDALIYRSTGTIATGLVQNQTVYARVLSTTTFTVHLNQLDAFNNTNIINVTVAGTSDTFYPAAVVSTSASKTGNELELNTLMYRTATAGTYTSIAMRLQARVDVSAMGFIEFNPNTSNTQGVQIGTGNSGTAYIAFSTRDTATEQARVTHTANATNYVYLTGSTGTNSVTVGANGAGTDVGVNIVTKGAGAFTVNGAAISGQVTVSATAPSSPSAGQQWVDLSTGIQYTYYSDGDSSQWVENGPDSGFTQADLDLKANIASPTFTGVPAAPTAVAGTNTTQLATTAFVATSFAPLASPTFTGVPAAPTAVAGTNTTQVATTAFVATSFAPLASPTFTGTPAAPTATGGTNTTQVATTAFVQSALTGAAGLGGNTFTGNQIVSDNQLSRAMLIDCGVVFLDKGNSSTTTQTLDYTTAGHFKITATGNFTIATSNWPPTGNLGTVLLELVNGGAFTITMPTINWIKPDGTTTTTFSTFLAANTGRTALQSSGTDFFVLWSRDAGTTLYGKLV